MTYADDLPNRQHDVAKYLSNAKDKLCERIARIDDRVDPIQILLRINQDTYSAQLVTKHSGTLTFQPTAKQRPSFFLKTVVDAAENFSKTLLTAAQAKHNQTLKTFQEAEDFVAALSQGLKSGDLKIGHSLFIILGDGYKGREGTIHLKGKTYTVKVTASGIFSAHIRFEIKEVTADEKTPGIRYSLSYKGKVFDSMKFQTHGQSWNFLEASNNKEAYQENIAQLGEKTKLLINQLNKQI